MKDNNGLNSLRENVIAFNEAFVANDLEAYFSFYAADATLLTPAGNLQTFSEWHEEWTETVKSGIRVVRMASYDPEPDSIRLSADGSSAVVLTYDESPMTFADPDGVESTLDWPESAVWWIIEGQWKIVHLHYHEPSIAK
jgi:ketosteroid isomerase-like protein